MFRWLILVVLSISFPVLADSPVTSTPFSSAYMDLKIVSYAAARGVVDEKIARKLLSKRTPVDVKAAIVNALSWDTDGKLNSVAFHQYLKKKYRKDALYPGDVTAEELMVQGYLWLMDDYFHPEKSVPYLKYAAAVKNDSFTVAIIYAIGKGQIALDNQWCDVWRSTEEVLNNQFLKSDMREEAIEIIVEYMKIYQDDCSS